MPMSNVLPRRVNGRRQTGSKHNRVHAALQKLDQIFTRGSRHPSRALEHTLEILFANVVLKAQALLLEELHAIVRLPPAALLADRSRRIRPLFHKTLCLGSQRDSERSRFFDFGASKIHCFISELPATHHNHAFRSECAPELIS